VLVDLAGDKAAVPPELDALLCQLGSSLDAEVSRGQFRTIVRGALALRQSQEIMRYEATGTTDAMAVSTERFEAHNSLPDGLRCSAESSPPPMRESARLIHRWAAFQSALPSWSGELSRLSVNPGGDDRPLEAHGGATAAADHWAAVQVALDKMLSIAESTQKHQGGDFPKEVGTMPEVLHDLQGSLTSFVRCFADEARARLRAAHASTGRLLDQRRRTVDDVSSQLEAKDIALQQAVDECAALSARLRAVEGRAAFAERLAADTATSLAAVQAALVDAEASAATPLSPLVGPPASPEALGSSVVSLIAEPGASLGRSLNGLAELTSALRVELDDAEQRIENAEMGRREALNRLHALEQRYEEEMLVAQAGISNPPAHAGFSSSLASLPLMQSTDSQAMAIKPRSLLEELKCNAHDSVEVGLRRDLQEAHGELERHWEEENRRQQAEDASAAADTAAIEVRLSQMHAGTVFEKVSFKHNVKQSRYVRLTFDCRRVEWAKHERGPFKPFPVQSIARIDYGDASRAFRCFEFGRRDRPAAGQCMSICTSTRSLDLIASSEHDIEVWVLGLNEIIPYRLERQRFTAQEFLLRRAMLHLEKGNATDHKAFDGSLPLDAECTSNGTSSIGTAALKGSGVEIARRGSGMSGRWGLPFRR